jgi:hypothetical protein
MNKSIKRLINEYAKSTENSEVLTLEFQNHVDNISLLFNYRLAVMKTVSNSDIFYRDLSKTKTPGL